MWRWIESVFNKHHSTTVYMHVTMKGRQTMRAPVRRTCAPLHTLHMCVSKKTNMTKQYITVALSVGTALIVVAAASSTIRDDLLSYSVLPGGGSNRGLVDLAIGDAKARVARAGLRIVGTVGGGDVVGDDHGHGHGRDRNATIFANASSPMTTVGMGKNGWTISDLVMVMDAGDESDHHHHHHHQQQQQQQQQRRNPQHQSPSPSPLPSSARPRKRRPALLINDMQQLFCKEEWCLGIVNETRALIDVFRRARLPIFWSIMWRNGSRDGLASVLDRANPGEMNSMGMGSSSLDPDDFRILPKLRPLAGTVEESRVLRKIFSFDMFHPSVDWKSTRSSTPLVAGDRGLEEALSPPSATLSQRLSALGVDTVVQAGIVTEYCVLSTAQGAAANMFDNAVLRGAVASPDADVAATALKILESTSSRVMGARDVVRDVSRLWL